MPPRAGQTRADRRDGIRRELLSIVEQRLLDGENFADIAVERLAADAGMSRTRFYLYFEDKNDLLRAWFADVSKEFATAASSWFDAHDEITPEALRDAISDVVETYRRHTSLMGALENAAANDARTRVVVAMGVDQFATQLQRHIQHAQESGLTDPVLDAFMIA